jgi:uroporphyrinogen decarboxylase
MIAGRGKDRQQGALDLMRHAPDVFAAIMARIESATIAYLKAQIVAGAEVVKLFDSWAAALAFDEALFDTWIIEPAARIRAALAADHPEVPFVAFPRGAGLHYERFARKVGAAGVAIDETVDARWAAATLQPLASVQGNLDSRHMVTGGDGLDRAVDAVFEALGGGPFVFNLGHGITPDADPANVDRLLKRIRG